MGSKTGSFDEDFSTNGDSAKETNASMIVNVNDTMTDIDNESNYSNRSENMNYDDNSDGSKGKKSSNSSHENRSKKDDNKKKSPSKDSRHRSKVDTTNTRYLWVNGIPTGTKTDQLNEVFQEHGNVLAIKIIRGGSSLLGFVKLETVEQAQNCMEKLNKTTFRGNTIEIFKERPPDTEKIGFSESRKFSTPKSRPPFRSSRRSYRVHSTPISPRMSHRIIHDRRSRADFNLERERHKLKMERIKLERDKAELLKLERESHRSYDRDRHDEKRIRSVKRSYNDDSYNDDKRFEDYNRREDFSSRRYDNNSERKISRSFGSRGRYEDNLRSERYSDNKYEQFEKSSKSWQTPPDWNNIGERWNNSNYDSSRLLSNIGSSSISRLHSDIPQGIHTRNYFNNRRY